MPGPSRNKGKGPDPGNWGNISSLDNFSEEELKQQREMLQNGDLVDFFPERASTPDLKKSRKRSKSPRPKKTKARAEVPRRVEVLVPPAAEAPLRRTVSVESLMKVPENSGVFLTASGSDPHPDRAPQSGLSVQSRQLVEVKPSKAGTETQPNGKTSKPAKGKTPLPRNLTPGGLAAEAFFEKALRGAPATSVARTRAPPSEPSDDSSSSSSESSDESSDDDSGNPRRGASSPRLSSKRKRGHNRKQKMLLKPIPPSRYNGEPEAEQVYFVSYYLDGKALDFYNQVVVPDEDAWTLKRFFTELFNFCFPVDYRNKQRKRLDRCFQGSKEVAAHVAEWSQIWNS
ncbi:hypothetical protein B0H19DRAFT_1203452, partial [Mycena capillaripes]